MTRVSLELGGKAPAIVWRDADLETAVPALVLARHLNAGQVCTCAERLFVQPDRPLAGCKLENARATLAAMVAAARHG